MQDTENFWQIEKVTEWGLSSSLTWADIPDTLSLDVLTSQMLPTYSGYMGAH